MWLWLKINSWLVVRISGCLGNSPLYCAYAGENSTSNAALQAAWNSSDEVTVKDSLGNPKRFFSKLGETAENSDRWLVHPTSGLKNKWWKTTSVLMGYILVLAVLVCVCVICLLIHLVFLKWFLNRCIWSKHPTKNEAEVLLNEDEWDNIFNCAGNKINHSQENMSS